VAIAYSLFTGGKAFCMKQKRPNLVYSNRQEMSARRLADTRAEELCGGYQSPESDGTITPLVNELIRQYVKSGSLSARIRSGSGRPAAPVILSDATKRVSQRSYGSPD
jgi:hypothetical protein